MPNQTPDDLAKIQTILEAFAPAIAEALEGAGLPEAVFVLSVYSDTRSSTTSNMDLEGVKALLELQLISFRMDSGAVRVGPLDQNPTMQ